jgi:TRAP-type C4-dicarboxylate transport system permease large subunit
VGVTLFVGSSIGEVPIERLVKANIPFYLLLIGVLMVITYVPAIVMWLPLTVVQ